ncbi:cytochrome P450 protein [Rutstroemia sp. NJR-2017a WRK4]|nr:cytochrome P450 protein [Rutstroemia sp. NJR-2017a WRK4]
MVQFENVETIPLRSTTTAITVCIVFCLYQLFRHLNPKKSVFDAPTVGTASDLRSALATGYEKYPESPFLLPTASHPTIILPIKYINEIKSLPPDKISFLEEFRDRYYGHYTAFANNVEGDAVTTSVKVDLTQSIARALENMQPETTLAFATEIPPTEDWTTITLYPLLLRVVAKVSGRVMVGEPLCRNEDWIKISTTYTRDTFIGGRAMWARHPLFRPIYALYSPELAKVRQHYTDAANFLRPIFEQRFAQMEVEGFEEPHDMIQWMINNSGKNARDATFQGRCQLLIAFAALHTTSGLLGNVILDLAARPEYIRALRQELDENLPEGSQITKQVLTRLRKMDSFLKESQRMNPLNLVTMNRKMMSTVQLSDGTVLPKGSFIGMAAGSIAFDASLFPDPHKFDGFRFSRLRQDPGAENKYQLVTTGKDSLAFGHGSHACPGRFFASNEIKTMLIELLRGYDWRLLPGTERPANLKSDMSLVVDPTAKIEIRKKAG